MKKTIKGVAGTIVLMTAVTLAVITQIPTKKVEASDTPTADFQVNNGVLVRYQGSSSTVSIPDKIEEIGEGAFAGNTDVVSVNIPDSVKKISYAAFENCTALQRISIPSGVEELGNAVFSGCSNLKRVSFGKGLKTVGSGIFAGCQKLEKVNIASKNKYLSYSAGVLYDKEKTTLIAMLPGREKNSFYFPSSVTTIRPYAFWGVENLEKVMLSQSLHEIPAYAFSNCKNLKGVEIPYSVYQIDIKAFENCVNLEEAIIHPSVSFIDETAFDGCNKLNIVAEEGTTAYEFAKAHPLPEEDLQEADNSEAVQPAQGASGTEGNSAGNTDTQGTPSNSGTNNSGYVDPLEYPDNPSVLGTTRVVGNDAFVIVNGTGYTVH